jgi:hypothetical protein
VLGMKGARPVSAPVSGHAATILARNFCGAKAGFTLKHDGLEPHEIGRRLVDVARANGHMRVQQAGGGASPDIVEIRLIDTGVIIYFAGRMWGYTLERQSAPRSGQLTNSR